jgi:hypothetical protein
MGVAMATGSKPLTIMGSPCYDYQVDTSPSPVPMAKQPTFDELHLVYNEARKIFDSNLSWEAKYDLILPMKLMLLHSWMNLIGIWAWLRVFMTRPN